MSATVFTPDTTLATLIPITLATTPVTTVATIQPGTILKTEPPTAIVSGTAISATEENFGVLLPVTTTTSTPGTTTATQPITPTPVTPSVSNPVTTTPDTNPPSTSPETTQESTGEKPGTTPLDTATLALSPVPTLATTPATTPATASETTPATTHSTAIGSVNVFILPNDHRSFSEAAKELFGIIAPTKTLFYRDGAVFEVTEDNNSFCLKLVTPDAFRSRIESYGSALYARVKNKNGGISLSPKNCSSDTAKAIMLTTAVQLLPRIKVITAAPVLVLQGNQVITALKGYHAINGGLLVTKGNMPMEETWQQGVRALLETIEEFDFASPSDKSRAIASLLTPALKLGGFIRGFIPADIAEADQSQSGKTYRQKTIRAVYGETSYPVTVKSGGVGSFDESLSAAILSGKPFVSIDNVRGKIESQFLESVITFEEPVSCRIPYKGEILVDCSNVNFQLTSNGFITTADFKNRASFCRIRKRPGHVYRKYGEGSLLEHIKAQQPIFLGAVHSVIREWHQRGMPITEETRHDFQEWAGKLDWIIQNLFKLAPLLDGHQEIQERACNPALNWLRLICLVIGKIGRLNESLRAIQVFEICEENGIEIPNFNNEGDAQKGAQVIGKLMKQCFSGDVVTSDSYEVIRSTKEEYDPGQRKNREIHYYIFTKKTQP